MPEPARNTLLTTQPVKGLYTLWVLLFNLTQFPLWLLLNIPPSFRKHPQWTFRSAIGIKVVRTFLGWCSAVEAITPYDLTPGREKDQWVTLVPAPSKYFTGVTLHDPSIKPSKTGVTWYPAQPTPGEKLDKVVLHFHGGAFVIGDGRIKDAGFLAKTILQNAGVQYVVCPNYRLASNPGGRFPAALQDAITAYTYLLNEKGINPKNIVFSGDSAGGNLALALLKYIADEGSKVSLPNPGCAWLWSPWVDPQGSTDRVRFFSSPNEPTDYLNPDFGAWGSKCYLPLKSTPTTDSYTNFVGHQFSSPVPMYFSIGEAEMLMHDDVEVYEAFKKLNKSVPIEMGLQTAAPHDIILVGDKVGMHKEAALAAKKAGQFLTQVKK